MLFRSRLRAHLFPGEDRARLATAEAAAELILPLLGDGCVRHGEVVRAEGQSSA